jgi:hypothetical protein
MRKLLDIFMGQAIEQKTINQSNKQTERRRSEWK